MSNRTVLFLALSFIFPVAALAPGLVAMEGDWVGYGGPHGQRVYQSKAPTNGMKVLWETPMPTWGHGQPIVVHDKIFLIREVGPENVFPVLVCLDAKGGSIIWQRELDHLSQVAGDAHALRKELKAYWDREAELLLAYYQATSGKKSNKGPTPSRDKPQKDAGAKLTKSMGLHRCSFRRNQYAGGLPCFGDAFGTPCSDGERVYATTTWGGHFAFDLDGKQLWCTWLSGGNWGWNNPGRSPILHKGVLYFDAADHLRALDADTGKVLWTDQKANENSMVSPAVISVGDKDVLLTAGEQAYLLPGGKKLSVDGWQDNGMQILVHPDQADIAYFCGSGEHCGWTKKGATEIQSPAAIQFSLNGDTLSGKVLWHGGTIGGKDMWGGNAPWMVVADGKFFHRSGHILDALSGEAIAKAEGKYSLKVPATSHMLKVAGGHVYGLRRDTLAVYDMNGAKQGEIKLEQKPLTSEQGVAHKYVCGNDKGWGDKKGDALRYSYSFTFTFGHGRVYARSMYNLICIGN